MSVLLLYKGRLENLTLRLVVSGYNATITTSSYPGTNPSDSFVATRHSTQTRGHNQAFPAHLESTESGSLAIPLWTGSGVTTASLSPYSDTLPTGSDPGNIPTVTVPGGSAAPQSTGSIALPPGVSSLVVIALQPGAASDITPSFAGAGPATTLSVSPSPIALQSGTSLEVTPGFGATESVVVTLQPGASPESTPGVAGAQPTTASLSAAPIALKPGESSEIAPGFVGAAPTITVYPSPIALQSGASSEVTPGLVGAESTVTGVPNPPDRSPHGSTLASHP